MVRSNDARSNVTRSGVAEPPQLTYCNLVWGINYQTHLKRLNILQKRAARVILGLSYCEHVTDKLRDINIWPIEQIIKKNCLMTIYKIKHSLTPLQMQNLLHWRQQNPIIPCVRQRGPLIVPFARTKYKQLTFKCFAPKLFNSLSVLYNIDLNVPISAFKAKVAEVMAADT